MTLLVLVVLVVLDCCRGFVTFPSALPLRVTRPAWPSTVPAAGEEKMKIRFMCRSVYCCRRSDLVARVVLRKDTCWLLALSEQVQSACTSYLLPCE